LLSVYFRFSCTLCQTYQAVIHLSLLSSRLTVLLLTVIACCRTSRFFLLLFYLRCFSLMVLVLNNDLIFHCSQTDLFGQTNIHSFLLHLPACRQAGYSYSVYLFYQFYPLTQLFIFLYLSDDLFAVFYLTDGIFIFFKKISKLHIEQFIFW